MRATLMDLENDLEISNRDGHPPTAGTITQSPYKLKDEDGSDGGFFIFPDMSIRLEGEFRIKFTLFELLQ